MTRGELDRYRTDPVAFLDRFVRKSELGKPFTLAPHQREILATVFAFDPDGRLPWDTIVYSTIKKSGKTTLAGALTLWWAFTQEAPNELKTVANDLEQSQARVFACIKGLLKHNPELGASADIRASKITLSNGSIIESLANDYAGEAGANQGWTSWTELWAFTSESSRRLWEELTPVPTRRNSIRFIDTYAGFLGESELLYDIYKAGVGKDESPEGRGERIHPTLPIYANRAARICAYWDHEPRMPWQTPQYYAGQHSSLRPNAYLRLHENRWVTGTEQFLTEALWNACVDPALRPVIQRPTFPVYGGVDVGIKGDNAAVVFVGQVGDRVVLASHRIWRPTKHDPIDLEDTIEAYLRDIWQRGNVRAIYCDPYQMHRSITTLQKAGIPIREYPQTSANLTEMGQNLFDLFKGRNVSLYESDELKAQALNTVAVESARGWRIAKEKTSRKIDAIVALAMASMGAIDAPQGAVYGEMFVDWLL
jgi:phage terminase large subunit-like protein